VLGVKSNDWNNPCGTGCNLVALMRGLIVSAAGAIAPTVVFNGWFVGAPALSVLSHPVAPDAVSCVNNIE
jgi:hypothetical protein